MPNQKPDLGELSTSQLQRLTGFAYKTVAKRLEQAGVKPSRQDGKTDYYRPPGALRALYEQAADPFADKKRLDAARAEAQEMKNAEARGELVPEPEVGIIGTAIASAVKMRVMALRTLGPSVRAAESDGEAAKLIEEGAREALSEIANLGGLVGELRRSRRARAEARGRAADGDEAAAESDDEPVG